MSDDPRDTIWQRYGEAFGDEVDDDDMFTSAPNWMLDPRLPALLEAAIKAGKPLTEAEVTAALGPPFREGVI
jgi:hypothetical protein